VVRSHAFIHRVIAARRSGAAGWRGIIIHDTNPVKAMPKECQNAYEFRFESTFLCSKQQGQIKFPVSQLTDVCNWNCIGTPAGAMAGKA
jgi:hypothetical protein